MPVRPYCTDATPCRPRSGLSWIRLAVLLAVLWSLNALVLLRFHTSGSATLVDHSESFVPAPPLGSMSSAASSALDDVVRLLLPTDEANTYIQKFPGNQFKFYVYDSLPEKYTWQHVSKCLARKFPNASSCDFGESICTETYSRSSLYSKRRFNRNGDIVMSKIFTQYNGSMRTYDPNRADLFVVPYPSAGNCECKKSFTKCGKNIPSTELDMAFRWNLAYFNKTTRFRHLFLVSNIYNDMHPYFKDQNKVPLVTTVGPARGCQPNQNCGQITMPYVNTNAEYQPDAINFTPLSERRYALTAFLSLTIAGDSKDRLDFFRTVVANNTTKAPAAILCGRPILVSQLSARSLEGVDGGEGAMLQAYRNSIFCICLKGDEPPQKRIFDVLLSGCIPVVLSYDTSRENGYPSHFGKEMESIRRTYPYSQGTFYTGRANATVPTSFNRMGIDWIQLVVPINGTCGMECLLPTLQQWLDERWNELVDKHEEMARVARLFSFGMEHNGLQSADALSALLVQARHFIHQHVDAVANSEPIRRSQTSEGSQRRRKTTNRLNAVLKAASHLRQKKKNKKQP